MGRSPRRATVQQEASEAAAYNSPEKKAQEADFAFGSPSERFPLFETEPLDEREGEEESEEVL